MTILSPSRLAPLTIALLLAGCTVGPDMVRPSLPEVATFPGAALHPASPTNVRAGEAFWRAFGDPVLDGLVDDALVANHDLRIALATLDRAEALLGEARAGALPRVTFDGTATDGRRSAGEAAGGPRDYEDARLGARLGWELDLFGRVRRGVESRRADTRAQQADLAAMQVAVVAELVSTYAQLRGLQERLRVARANAEVQRETRSLVEARVSAGRGSDFDLRRASAQLASTEARVPALEAAVAAAMHRVAVLTGRPPEALATQLAAPGVVLSAPAALSPDAPAEVLRRRPDVIAAEHRLHAATARIGVAVADLFPRLSLSGLLGVQSFDIDALGGRGDGNRWVALGIDWSFLDVGRVRARIAAADADARGALAAYDKTVLRALEDTGNALVLNARTREEDGWLGRASEDATAAARLARLRYDAGAASLLEVLDAERTRLQAEDALAEARTRHVLSAVQVFRALAGGWPERTPARVAIPGR